MFFRSNGETETENVNKLQEEQTTLTNKLKHIQQSNFQTAAECNTLKQEQQQLRSQLG